MKQFLFFHFQKKKKTEDYFMSTCDVDLYRIVTECYNDWFLRTIYFQYFNMIRKQYEVSLKKAVLTNQILENKVKCIW